MNRKLILKILSRLNAPEFVKNILVEKDVIDPILNNPDEAWAYLITLHPDPQNSCICKHELSEPDCDLEVIVPCYNVEQYVEECLDSILSQETKYSFFVTVVNDGSTDGTREVLKKYENKSRVRVIEQENKGHSGARNTAIAQAHGKYLMFVDSDDVLLPGSLDNLLTLAEKTDADVVDSGHIRFADPITSNGIDGRIKSTLYDFLVKPFSLDYNENADSVSGFPCGKIIKSTLFRNIQFPQGYWFEDTIMWMVIEPFYRRKATHDKLTFRYRMNPNSVSHTSGGKLKTLDTLYITVQLMRDRKTLGIENDQYAYENFLRQMRMNMYRCQGFGPKIRQALFAVQRELLEEYFSGFSTNKTELISIQSTIRSGDYNEFYKYVQLN